MCSEVLRICSLLLGDQAALILRGFRLKEVQPWWKLVEHGGRTTAESGVGRTHLRKRML